MKTPWALAAAAWLAASCGPEKFHRDLERDAAGDAQPGADQPDAGDDVLADDAADGAGADASDDGVGPDGPCATSFAGDLLYAFNTQAGVFSGPAPDPKGTLPAGWFSYPEPMASAPLRDSTSGWSGIEGHACPGALAMNANFTVYGPLEKVLALVNFNANWMTPKAYARLHAWVKIPLPSSGNLDHLDGLQLAANTNNYTSFLGITVPVTAWVDGDWHEIVLELVPATNYVPSDVRQVGVQLIAKSAAGVGPSAPVPTTFFVDDIWLEP